MKQPLMVWGVSLFLLTAHAEEKNLMPRFERVREIDGSFAVGERGRIVVPSDVFGQARSFPADLRILAADGTQWPFFLHLPKTSAEDAVFDLEILNRSFVSGRESYLQFDLIIPEKFGKKPIHNQVELVTLGHDLCGGWRFSMDKETR